MGPVLQLRTNFSTATSPLPFMKTNPQIILTPQEQKVFEIMGNGMGNGTASNKAIGIILCLSPHTIKNHKENLKAKLGMGYYQELLQLAIKAKADDNK